MILYEFTFIGINRDTNEQKEFTEIAGSRIAAFDRVKSKYKGWDFKY